MRRLALGLSLVLASPALAQGTPANPPPQQPATPPAQQGAAQAPTLRVDVDLSCQVEDQPESPDSFQYYVWERLNKFGLRVDSLRPVGDQRLDQFVANVAAKHSKLPDQAPATLHITGSAVSTYANAEFFGQGQAHTFRGRIDVELKDASGARIAQFGLAHEWGRLPQQYTKSKTKSEYHQMVQGAVVLWLLTRPEVAAGVPEGKRAELAAFIAETKQKLLHPLVEADMTGELRTFLEGLSAPAAPAPADGGKPSTPPPATPPAGGGH